MFSKVISAKIFSENEDDDRLFKHEFFEAEFQKKGIYNAILKKKRSNVVSRKVVSFLIQIYDKNTIYINENSNTQKILTN